jgi:O-antigen ligase
MSIEQRENTPALNDPDASPITSEGKRERTPWLLAFLCFVIPALPTFVVLPGPLKSNGSPARAIAITFLLLVILGSVLMRRTTPTRRARPGIALMLLYFLLVLTVYGVGLTHVDSWTVEASKTRSMIMVVANTGLGLYALTRVETLRQRTVVLGSLAMGLTFACVVGLLQQFNIDLRFFFEPPGFVLNFEYLNLTERLGAKRVVGTSQHAIEFAVLAVMTVPLTIHFARFAVHRSVRWLAVLACGLALLAIPAAVSRTGVLALIAALLLYMWNFKVRTLAVALAGGTTAVLAYIVAFPTVAAALWDTIVNSEQDESILARQADYATVSDTFREHPLFGLGLGASTPSEYGFLDNEWLQAIVQGGTVGLAAMIVLAGGGIFGISAALRSARTPRERDQAYVLGSMFVAILVSSFTFDLFSFQQPTTILFLIFGLLWSSFTVALPEREPAPQRELSSV